MEDESFKILVRGPGIQVDRNVTEDVVYRVLQILLRAGEEVRQRRASGLAQAELGRALTRFFDRHRPGTNAERIAGVVGFVERFYERSTKREEIPDWLVMANQPVPSNLSRDIGLAIEKGLINQLPDEGLGLTPLGEQRFLQAPSDRRTDQAMMRERARRRHIESLGRIRGGEQ